MPNLTAFPWPGRCAWGALISAFPLILVGGVVTTIGAGMAVQGWWDAEGHFMPFFPLDMWLRDTATFVEHSHRQVGMLVGIFALLAALLSLRPGVALAARWASWVALIAVGFQGWLGGMRVLENSRNLAFAHGGVAQAVFSLLAVAALLHRQQPGWGKGGTMPAPRAWLWATALLVYAQIWVGAWYRHGLRGGAFEIQGRLHLHLGLAAVVTVVVVLLARRLKRLASNWRAEGLAAADGPLRLSRAIHMLLGLQLLLGLLAWLGHSGSAGQGSVNVLEVIAAVGHVLVGALLLAALIIGALRAAWSRAPVGALPAASGGSSAASQPASAAHAALRR